jgi:hypothetical protein
MASPAQIAANRRNALKSTGPRTTAGKAVSSRNALRHGLRARRAVVPGEDPAEFERFRAELRDALAPADEREELLARAVAEAAWRRRRAWRAEAALFRRAGRSDPRLPPLRELESLARYEATAERSFHRAVTMLERGRGVGARGAMPRRQEAPIENVDSAEGSQISGATPAPNSLMSLLLGGSQEPDGFRGKPSRSALIRRNRPNFRRFWLGSPGIPARSRPADNLDRHSAALAGIGGS